MIKMRDGSLVSDPRLGRLPEFDKRNQLYNICQLLPEKKYEPRSYTWRCSVILDQGQEGSCVGHGWAHELIARPAEHKDIDHQFAVEQIYYPAQKLDNWPGGSYQGALPFYEGTSVLAGAKAVQKLGLIGGYYWAEDLEDLVIGIGYHGPCVIGVNWYEGMFATEVNGRIRPTGRKSGGHCVLLNGVNVRQKLFYGVNSWGTSWGMKGKFCISFEDVEKLMDENGEFCFAKSRK